MSSFLFKIERISPSAYRHDARFLVCFIHDRLRLRVVGLEGELCRRYFVCCLATGISDASCIRTRRDGSPPEFYRGFDRCPHLFDSIKSFRIFLEPARCVTRFTQALVYLPANRASGLVEERESYIVRDQYTNPEPILSYSLQYILQAAR